MVIERKKYDNSSVILQTKSNENTGAQNWERSKVDKDGWFTIKNPQSGLFLKSHQKTDNLTVEGNQ